MNVFAPLTRWWSPSRTAEVAMPATSDPARRDRRSTSRRRHDGPDHQRGIGHPSGHHHVGSGVERRRDSKRSQVGVGGERGPVPQLVGPTQEAVAFDVGVLGRDPETFRQLTQPVRQPGRVEPTGFTTILTLASIARPRQSSICQTTVVAYPRSGSVDLTSVHESVGAFLRGWHVRPSEPSSAWLSLPVRMVNQPHPSIRRHMP